MKTLITLFIISIIRISAPMKLTIVEADNFSVHSTDKNILYKLQNDSTMLIRYNGILPQDTIKVLVKTPNKLKIEVSRNLKIVNNL